jgi:hypothetical protein
MEFVCCFVEDEEDRGEKIILRLEESLRYLSHEGKYKKAASDNIVSSY